MSDLPERLKRDAAALEELERKRSENRMSPADWEEEQNILARGLSDLEEDTLSNPAALDAHLVPVRRRKRSR